MKDDNTFNEELFRDAFSDFTPEPPKDLLDKVQKSRGRSNTSKKGWIAGASALLIISAIGLYNNNPETTVEAALPATEVHVSEAEEEALETPVIEEVQIVDTKKEAPVEKKTPIQITVIDTVKKEIIIYTDDESKINTKKSGSTLEEIKANQIPDEDITF